MDRRPARNQALPQQEVEYLNSLDQDALIQRANELYRQGWTLQSIGDSLTPPRSRSTVRSWVLRYQLPTSERPAPAPLPSPNYATHPDGYQSRRPASPGILPDELTLIQELAPIARQYRSKMPNASAAAVANDRLTGICVRLYTSGVPIRELANAAGVTYRAMSKRVKR
jgi:hypothetical protein